MVQDRSNSRNQILLGRGDGTFRGPLASNVPSGSNYGPMATADLNGDGVLDLAMSDGISDIQIMLGNGRGGFRAGTLIHTKAIAIDSLIAADLEGNGNPSLAATTGIDFGDTFCDIGPGVAVLSPAPNGSWHETDYPTGIDSENVQAADMNGDGRLDLVVANAFSSSISILLNKGSGGSGLFSPALRYTPGASFLDNVVVKDLNRDGKPDVLFIPFGGTLNVMLNQSEGRFLAGNLVDISLLPQAMAASDLNHDGIPDLALIGFPNCAQDISVEFITVLSEGGRALATQRVNYKNNDIAQMGLGDLNGDGSVDTVLAQGYGTAPLISLFNNGKGAFSLAPHPETEVMEDAFALGNFNSDNRADVATLINTSSELEVRPGKGDGGFGSPVTYKTGTQPVSTTQRDLNGDGHRDLVVANFGDNTVDVFLGTADGKFQPAKSYAAGPSPSQITFGDFNRDGKVDLAVANINTISILLGRGDGTFSAPHAFPVGDQVNYIAVADLRGNGDQDVVVVVDNGNPYMYVLSGDGKGSLSKPVRYSGTDNAVGIATGDFNGDGAVDVAVQNYASTGPTIFYNQGGTHISLVSSAKDISAGQNVTFTATVLASIGGTGTPTGTVAFRSGSSLLGTGRLIGSTASFSTPKLSNGTHSIFASYWGDSNFNPHLSSVVSVSVEP